MQAQMCNYAFHSFRLNVQIKLLSNSHFSHISPSPFVNVPIKQFQGRDGGLHSTPHPSPPFSPLPQGVCYLSVDSCQQLLRDQCQGSLGPRQWWPLCTMARLRAAARQQRTQPDLCQPVPQPKVQRGVSARGRGGPCVCMHTHMHMHMHMRMRMHMHMHMHAGG